MMIAAKRDGGTGGLSPLAAMLSLLVWIGLCLCSVQLARIDLPDPQTRVDRAIAGRGLATLATAERPARDPHPAAGVGPLIAVAATAAVGGPLVWFAASHLSPVPDTTAIRRVSSGFAARAPPQS